MSTPVVQFTAGSNFSRDEQLARLAVERVAEAVAVEVDQQLALLPVDLLVDEDLLVDAVEVPLVMRGHLVDPLRHPVIRDRGRRCVIDHLLSPGRCAGFQVEGLPEP